jgi:hypothetical protein
MNPTIQNKQFDALRGLSPEAQQELITTRRVVVTSARFTPEEASRHLGVALPPDYPLPSDGRITFSGRVITPTPLLREEREANPLAWEEVDALVQERPFGEKVDGVLVGLL